MSSLFVKVINGLSSKDIPYDKLFHLGFLLTIGFTKIRLEKECCHGIDAYYTLKPERKTIHVPYNKQITLNEVLNNTINKVGKKKVCKYSSFQFNCQCFVKDVLVEQSL